MTKLSIAYVRELFKSQGLQLSDSAKYTNNKTPMSCTIQQGKFKGYNADISVDGLQQRITRGKGGDFTLGSLTTAERLRYIDNRCKQYNYVLVDPPENGLSTRPLVVAKPDGTKWKTTWNQLETKLNKLELPSSQDSRNKAEFTMSMLKWSDNYNVELTGRVDDRVLFTFLTGEYMGCTGSVPTSSVRGMREPGFRSLDSEGMATYSKTLCDRLGLTYLALIEDNEIERTNWSVIFVVSTGIFAGYKGTRSISNLRQSLRDGVTKHTIEILTKGERVRYIADFANSLGYTLYNFPYELRVQDKLELICPKGHKWQTSWDNFYRGNRCPKCTTSYKGERLVERILRECKVPFKTQYPIRVPTIKRLQFFDFYLPEHKIAIEYNGKQHYEPVECYGGEKAFKLNQARDQAKRDYCAENSITLLELPYTLTDQEVKEKIMQVLIIKKKSNKVVDTTLDS